MIENKSKNESEYKLEIWNKDSQKIAITSGLLGMIGVGLFASTHFLEVNNNTLDFISQYISVGGFATAGVAILTTLGLHLYDEYKNDVDTILGATPAQKKKRNTDFKYLIKDTRNGELNFYLMDEHHKEQFIKTLSPKDEICMVEIHKENVYIKKMRNGKFHNSKGPGFAEIYNKETVDKESYLDIINELYFIDGKSVKKLHNKKDSEKNRILKI